MLSKEQIIEKIKEPVSKDALADGIRIQNRHKVHITGDGYKDKLVRHSGFESEDDYNIRKQLTSPGTVQLSAIILDNLNRWATNQGTVKNIQFKKDGDAENFRKVLSQVWRGDSMENFIRTFYKEAIYQEMMGFLIVTKPQLTNDKTQIREGVESPYAGGDLDPYIIFINAESVHDFNAVGDKVEYLIIKYGSYTQDSKEYHTYRVIDDKQDTIITFQGDDVYLYDDKMHEVGHTPAIQISSITKHLVSDKIKTSPIDHVMPALDRYMQKDSDLIIQMVRHMYPKLVSVVTDCKLCEGRGYNYDAETQVTCKHCNGTGKVIPFGRDGILGIPQYLNDGHTPYPGSPASYITPDNDSLRTAMEDLESLGKDILYSATGDKNLIVEGLETATENLINFKGLEDRISEIVNMVESREEFLIETIAKMHIGFKDKFKAVSVRYGRRLTVRGENEILSEIVSAKESGMPISHIETLQKELIYTRYKNNPIEMERHMLLSDVEPLNGYTVSEVLDMADYVEPADLKVKFNFNKLIDWFESKKGPIVQYKENVDRSKRIEEIYQILKDEVLRVEGDNSIDPGNVLETSIEE